MGGTELMKPRWWESRNNWLWFLITFLLFFVHVLTTRFNALYFDSRLYWDLANGFDQNGNSRFSIYNFNSALRGYLFPLLHYPVAVLARGIFAGNETVVVKFFGACWAAALFGVVCPALWERATGRVVSRWRRLLFIVVCFILWRDYFNFILSDFPSALMLLLALLWAYRAKSYWAVAGSGALIAAAVYTRPLYLLAVPFVLWLLLQQLRAQEETTSYFRRSAAIRVGLFFLAFLLVGTPQYLINSNNYQSKSFLVLAKGASDGQNAAADANLYLYKLNEGIGRQRYETNIGPDYPSSQAPYEDPAGKALLEANGGQPFGSYAEYFTFVFLHPIDMTMLYLRHLFNGLDTLYAGPYVYKLHGSTLLNSLVVYTVLFAACLVIAMRVKRLRLSHWIIVGALLITCLASLPLMIECRFFAPLHLLLYAVACYGWPAQWTWKGTSLPKTLAVLVAYGLFVVLCLTLSRNTQAQLEQLPTAPAAY